MRVWLLLLASAVCCTLPLLAALSVDASVALPQAQALATRVFGASAAGYLGFCPRRLVLYCVTAISTRHVTVLLLAAAASELVSRTHIAWVHLLGVLALSFVTLSGAGALWVALTCAQADGSTLAWSWGREVGSAAAAAGVPVLSLALGVVVLLRRRPWLRRVALLLVVGMCAAAAVALRQEHAWPILPGLIDAAQARGQGWNRLLVAALWLAPTLLTAHLLDPSRSRSRAVGGRALA